MNFQTALSRIAVCAILMISKASVALSTEPRLPNIIWLSCEDMSPRLGCYGDFTVPTPNIDQLAHESIRYTRAFTATGVCAPCRHTIITGLYPMQSGAQYMRTMSRSSAIDQLADPQLRAEAETRPLYEATPPAGVRCFTEYLRMAGYYCTNNSKTDYQFQPPLTAWDESSRKAHYRNRKPGQPFFAVFNQGVTHESGVHGQGRSPQKTDPANVPVPSFLPDTPIVRIDIARHYDNIRVLDEWVGKMIADLKADGLFNSTIIFFFSDHGDGLPRHKRWVYDSGTRVPMIIRFPDGFQANTVDDRLMSFVDLAPTALHLAGIAPPDYMLGHVFAGPSSDPPPRQVFMHRDRMDDTSFDTIRSVRDERFRYVRNYRPGMPYFQLVSYRDRAATMGEIYRLKAAGELTADQWQWSVGSKPVDELYDTKTDPDEVHNLAEDPKYGEKLSELRVALDSWTEQINDPLATPEIEVIKTRVWPPNGKQPTTAKPQVEVTESDNGIRLVSLECATAGASVGYRTTDKGPWTVYDAPFETDADQIEVVAQRIGWKRAKLSVDISIPKQN